VYSAAIPQNVVGALIAVGGVVIGGLLTFAANFLLERAREKHDARAAETLFRHEINDALKELQKGSRERRWPLGWKPWPNTWESYRAAAASQWPTSKFSRVATAYAHMYGLDHGLRDGHEGDRKLKGDDEQFFTAATADLEKARAEFATQGDGSLEESEE
jgi:hypothetical protein